MPWAAPFKLFLHDPDGTSYTYRSVQGIGKRSADAEADADAYYGYGYGYPLAYGYGHSYGYLNNGIAGHPDGTSYTYRSVQGIGKRSADAEPAAEADADAYYGYGYGYPLAYGYSYNTYNGYNGYPYAYGGYHY